MKFYAPVDRNGNKVLAVWPLDGKDYAYLYRRENGNEGVSFALNELVAVPLCYVVNIAAVMDAWVKSIETKPVSCVLPEKSYMYIPPAVVAE